MKLKPGISFENLITTTTKGESMGYISSITKNDEVLVWERTDNGRKLKTYPAPYYFYARSSVGEYTSIYGDKLARFDFTNGRDFREVVMECESSNIKIFESDIPPELKILSEHYYNVPAPKLHVTFLDIEVDYHTEVGFASEANPYAPINSVALYHTWNNRYVVLAVPPEGDDQIGAASEEFMSKLNELAPLPEAEVEVLFLRNEKELLHHLLVEIEDSDILCGWNSDFFDLPYITRRLEKLGGQYVRRLSFPEANKPKWREVQRMAGMKNNVVDLSGRHSTDYLDLFRKYEYAERPSYKLESIAEEILPDLPKLAYEGTLHQLYRNDFAFFVRYNLRDTEILQGFEERLGYVDLANQMYHLSTGLFKHVTGTLKLAELATINYCHHQLGLIVNNIDVPDTDQAIQGAYVLEPKVGEHKFLGSIDINSLYPSSIRSINISPETLMGQFDGEVRAAEEIKKSSLAELSFQFDDRIHIPEHLRGKTMQATAEEWKKTLRENKWAVSGFGTVFDQNKPGIIPTILANWYSMRKQYQKQKAEAKDAGDELKAAYYDRLQYVFKIKLNSFYGALTNRFFRFYDLRMGESTTGTGRAILRHQCAKANEIMTGTYDTEGEAVIYGDTDSTYFETWTEDIDTAVKVADRVGDLVNESFPDFMRESFLCSSGFDEIIKAGREIVSDHGIFVDKKRYILHVADNEGYRVDKLKVMGLDTKKTTLPKEISKELNTFIERYLKGESWEVIAEDIVTFKDKIETTDDIMSIGLPKGVKRVEHYTQELKAYGEGVRLPGHVAASILYNICREKYKDHESLPITSGMKIKVFYLTSKVGRFKSIAVPVDIEQVPQWFLDDFTVDRQAHTERLVDKPLGNIIKAIGKDVPSRQTLLNNSLLEW